MSAQRPMPSPLPPPPKYEPTASWRLIAGIVAVMVVAIVVAAVWVTSL